MRTIEINTNGVCMNAHEDAVQPNEIVQFRIVNSGTTILVYGSSTNLGAMCSTCPFAVRGIRCPHLYREVYGWMRLCRNVIFTDAGNMLEEF